MAITSLASQLKQLETPQSSLLIHRTKRASFLFDEKEAASIDRDSFYEIGLSGLEELKKLNQQFEIFEHTLFDITSKTFERSVQSSDVNNKLNKQIKDILILLSPYFLLKSAHKVLEWLINRYHVHQFNIDEILLLGLPYHETMTFARLLQLIPVSEDKGKWNWLAPVKKSGVPLSKTALLNRAATDTAFFKFICDMVMDSTKVYGENANKLSTMYCFYCSTIVGSFESSKQITDLHVSLVLPSIMSALSSTQIDFTSSAFIILARLTTKISLSDKLVSAIYNKISKVKGEKLKHEIVLVLIVLSQSSLCVIPRSALLRFASLSYIVPSISFWSSRDLMALPLIINILSAILLAIDDESTDEASLDLIKGFFDKLLTLVFDEPEAKEIFKTLIKGWKGKENKWFQDTLIQLQISCPQAFDSASSDALAVESQAATLKTLLGMTSSRNSVFDSLVHPNPDLRAEALYLIKSSYKPEKVGWLCETVLARLADDSPKVVKAALSCKPAFVVADKLSSKEALVQCLFRCWSVNIHKKNLCRSLVSLLTYCPEDEPLLDLMIFPVIATNMSFVSNSKLSDTKSGLITFIKEKFADGKEEDEIIWLCLQEYILPKYSQSIDEISKLHEFHCIFKFLSLVVLSKVPSDFEPSILSNYLKSSLITVSDTVEMVDGKSLKACFNDCNRNSLPLQPALNLLVKCNVNDDGTAEKVDRKIVCHNISSPAYKKLFDVFYILIDGFSKSSDKKIKKSFNMAILNYFEENFVDKEELLNFLLSCAVWNSNRNENFSLTCIHHVSQILKSNSQGVKHTAGDAKSHSVSLAASCLNYKSPAVPMLMSLLHSSDGGLRRKVLKIFNYLIEPISIMPGYRSFVEQIITNSEEIKLDSEQIVVLCYTQLSPAKEIRSLLPSDVKQHMKNTLNAIITLITDPGTPVYITAHILDILECVNSSDLLIKFLPVLSLYIGKDLILDKFESKVVKHLLRKFDDTQGSSFSDEEMWISLDKILSDSTTSIKGLLDSDENTNPSAYLINLIPALLYENLPNPRIENQKRFLTSVITNTYECENVKVANAVTIFFRKISMDGEIIANLLKWFTNNPSPIKTSPMNIRIRRSLSNIPKLEQLESPDWKKGVFLLEQIQSKNKLTNCCLLIPVLFDILKKCLLFEQQSPVEYTKQLILSVLLQCCQAVGSAPISPELIQVDLIVQCLRISQNPQTHHHALLTLTIIANLLPDNVLHSIMEIFTFIGTTIARQDDAYSFQIISKLIETIVPILVKGRGVEVVGVVRVFVTAMLDIPEHRRQLLLIKLLITLGANDHLWLFLALVFESHVLKSSTSQTKVPENEKSTKKLEVASQLCSEFEVPTLLETSAQLLELATLLPHDKDVGQKENTQLDDVLIKSSKFINNIDSRDVFNFESNTGKQLRHFKYTLLGFVSSLLSSDVFIQQIALMSDEDTSDLKEELERVLEFCLTYVRQLTRLHEKILQESNLPCPRYWKVMINQTYDVMDKVVGVLPVNSFVDVVCSLLQDSKGCCPRKIIELITWRLGQGRPVPAPALRPLLEPLTQIALSSSADLLNRQSALIALKLLIRHLASTYRDDFIEVLKKLTDVLCEDNMPSWEVTGSLILCLGELVSSLGAHSISQLSRFMPSLLKKLKDDDNQQSELFLLSCVTCLHKLVESLSNFLSPYMEKIIYCVCHLMANLQSNENAEKGAPIIIKLKSIRSKLASSVDGRVIVPAINKCFSKVLKLNDLEAMAPLMTLLADSFAAGTKSSPDLISLFLKGLAFRCETNDPSTVDLVEPHVLSALTALVLKLSESAFRPVYNKIYDWAIRSSSDPLRAVTFYRLSSGLAEKLRGLFALFAATFVTNSAKLLDLYNSTKGNKISTSEEDSLLLVECIIKTLHSVFTHDSHNFLTKERFNLLLQPLVDQLENELGGTEARAERNEKLLTPCLASMAAATGDDSLWKQLNYQVLLKMRHAHPEVRLAALETVHLIVKKLGEDFLPLLPETVPFLAELLEDSDESIEKQTHRSIASMEAVLGEPIQKYF